MRGCSVFTRPPSISGKSVSVSTRSTVEAELLEVRRRAAARDELPAELVEAAREDVEAGLVVGRDQRCAQLSHDAGQQAVLDLLDACVQRLGRVVAADCDSLLREDRPAVDALVDEVHGRAGLGDAGGELLLDGVRAGELRQQRRVHVDDRAGEAIEERRREEVHVAGEHDEANAVAAQPVGHRGVALRAVGVRRRARTRLSARRVRARARRVVPVARDGDDGQPRVEQRLQVRAGAADEDADHAVSVPITSAPSGGSRHDGAHADAEVEDAARFVLLDALLGEPVEHRRALPRVPVDLRVHAVGEDARRGCRGCRRRSRARVLDVGARAERANLVEVETVRREQHVGVEVAVADEGADEREAVRVQPARREADDRRRRARTVSRRSGCRGRRCRRRCRRSRARRRGTRREARRSRRRSACSRPRGRPRRRPRRGRRPARARCAPRRRSRGRRAARRRCRARR